MTSQPSPPPSSNANLDPLRSFSGRFAPVSVPAGYRLSLLLMVILLLANLAIYAGLIALVVWLLVAGVGWLDSGGMGMRSTVYIGIALIGAVFGLYILIRPWWSVWRKRPSPGIPLMRASEPDVHAFVATIATLVGAPLPERIMVNCQVNAGASLASVVRGKLVLHIGLPIVGGLNCRQFAGVIAHELGHFAQSAGMRTTWFVRTTEYALARAMHDLDRSMAGNARAWPLRLALRVPWFVMWLSLRASRSFMRQMEKDADRYEARVAGSDTFPVTAVRLAELNFAQSLLPDLRGNVVARTLDKWRELDLQQKAFVRALVKNGQTRWQDTHPSDAERIAMAKDEQAPGVYRCEAPATALFREFGKLSQWATRDLRTQV